jgi:hypothetical protein
MRRVAVALAIGVTLTGCGASQTATPFVPAVTPSPVETPSETPSETPIASETPAASESATPTLAPTVAPTDTPAPTLPPVSAGDATKCLGWATYGAEFTKAAKSLKFNVDVYCAVLPSGWYVTTPFKWSQPKGVAGSLVVTYKRNTAVLTVSEGNFCAGCAYVDLSDLGSASFGSLSADLKLRSTGTYALYVNPGATVQYQMVGKGMTQAAFVAMAAAMVKVPKA